MSTLTARRGLLTLAVTSALLTGSFAFVSSARASNLYACVKKNGSAHVFAKKPKCKKGESKLSWGTSGPAGKNGGNGADGKNGANGADGKNGGSGADGRNGVDGTNGVDGLNGTVGGFSATGGEVGYAGGTEGSPVTVLSKALPAGNFIVSGKVEALLSDTKAGGAAATTCKMIDVPTGGGTTTTDRAAWATLIDVQFAIINVAEATLPFDMAVVSPARASTVSIVCFLTMKEAAGGVLTANADESEITAIQTSTNS